MNNRSDGTLRPKASVATYARDYRFDNLKTLLIALVVFGHTIQQAARTSDVFYIRFPYWIDAVIFTFHMPAFVFISGYFSSSKKSLVELIVPLLGLYLLAQWLWTGYNCMVSSSWPDLLALSGLLPGWGLWYLLSLATWRVTVPILKGIRSPVIFLVFAALVGAAAGHTNLGPILSLSRTVVFFPYFAAGFFARELNWQSLLGEQRRKIDFAVLALAIALLPCLLYFVHLSDRMILYFDSPLAAVPIRFSWGFIFRILAYLFAFAVIRWLMLLIPKSQHKWTRIGEATLGIYLGHFYFLLILQHYIPKQDVGLMFLLSPFITLALLWLLSRPALVDRLNALYEGMRRPAMRLNVPKNGKSVID